MTSIAWDGEDLGNYNNNEDPSRLSYMRERVAQFREVDVLCQGNRDSIGQHHHGCHILRHNCVQQVTKIQRWEFDKKNQKPWNNR